MDRAYDFLQSVGDHDSIEDYKDLYERLADVAINIPEKVPEIFELYKDLMLSDENTDDDKSEARIWLYSAMGEAPLLAPHVWKIMSDTDNINSLQNNMHKFLEADIFLAPQVFEMWKNIHDTKTAKLLIRQTEYAESVVDGYIEDLKNGSSSYDVLDAFKEALVFEPESKDRIFDALKLYYKPHTPTEFIKILQRSPECADDVFDTLKVWTEKYPNLWSSHGYHSSMNMGTLLKDNPELAPKVFKFNSDMLQQGNFYDPNYDIWLDLLIHNVDFSDQIIELCYESLASDKNKKQNIESLCQKISDVLSHAPYLADDFLGIHIKAIQSVYVDDDILNISYRNSMNWIIDENSDPHPKVFELLKHCLLAPENTWSTYNIAISTLMTSANKKPEQIPNILNLLKDVLGRPDGKGFFDNGIATLIDLAKENPEYEQLAFDTFVDIVRKQTDLSVVYDKCSDFIKRKPNFTKDIFDLCQGLIKENALSLKNFSSTTKLLRDVILNQPSLSKDGLDIIKQLAKNKEHNANTISPLVETLSVIYKADQSLAPELIDVYTDLMMLGSVDKKIYKNMSEIVANDLSLVPTILNAYDKAINNSDARDICTRVYGSLYAILRDNPAFETGFKESYAKILASDKNSKNSLKEAAKCLSEVSSLGYKQIAFDLAFDVIKSDKNGYESFGGFYSILIKTVLDSNANIDTMQGINRVYEFIKENALTKNANNMLTKIDTYQILFIESMMSDDSTKDVISFIDKALWTKTVDNKDVLTRLHRTLIKIAGEKPEFSDDIFKIVSEHLTVNDLSYDNFRSSCYVLSELVKAKPELAPDAFSLVNASLERLTHNPKDDIDINLPTNALAEIIKHKPDLVEDVYATYNKIQDYKKSVSTIDEFIDSYLDITLDFPSDQTCNLYAELIKAKPELADEIYPNLVKYNLLAIDPGYTLLAMIADNRKDMVPQIKAQYPDLDVGLLKSSCRISEQIDNRYISSIYETLKGSSEENINRLERVFTTKQLDVEDRKKLFSMLKDKSIPEQDLVEFNPSAYNEIKEYMLAKEAEAHPNLTPEEVYDQSIEWLSESAIYATVLYKKDYKRYFNVIEKYNAQLPKLKEKMPEVMEEYYVKKAKLLEELRAIEEERKANDTRLLGLEPGSEGYHEMRERYDALGIKERGIKGNLLGIVGYINYDQLQPVGIEKATAWMQQAMKVSDREGLLRKINKSLLGTNPNILACGSVGQPFVRVDHQTPIIDSMGNRTGEETVDELMMVSAKWDVLSAEVKSKGFKEIVDVVQSYKFAGKSMEFMEANAKYIYDQETYTEAEKIYEKGKLTPSRFEHKEHYSEDGNWRCYIADKDDPRPLYAGGNWADRAKCCQSYKGMGSKCAVDSVLNPDSGCVIFERKVKSKDKFGITEDIWEMVGCSWCYEVQSGGYKKLIFDNVEINDNHQDEQVSINEAFYGLVEDLEKNNYREIRIGNSPDIELESFTTSDTVENLPWNYSGYSDAEYTQYILSDNPKATPEQLPEIMVVGMDLEKHQAGMYKVAAKAFPKGSQNIEIPQDPKGMVLINRDNNVIGYVIWTENSREMHAEKPVNNWITDMAVLPEYRGNVGFKLLTEMMKHVQKTGGTWGAELRDSTSFKYMMTMSDKVKNGEIAGVDSDFRGRAKVDLEVVSYDYTMEREKGQEEGSKVYRCVFTPLTEEETKARLQARKIEEMASKTRDKLEDKHYQQPQQSQEVHTTATELSPVTSVNLSNSKSGKGVL